MNAKIVYHEEFSGLEEFPSVEECSQVISNDFGVPLGLVEQAFNRIDLDGNGRVDENMFLALYADAEQRRDTALSVAGKEANYQQKSGVSTGRISWCTSICHGCDRVRLSQDFLSAIDRKLVGLCRHCRKDEPTFMQPKRIFSRIDVDTLDWQGLAPLHLLNKEAAAVSEKGLDCWYIERKSKTLGRNDAGASDPWNSNPAPNPSSNKGEKGNVEKKQERGGCELSTSRETFENAIRGVIHRIEGYNYTRWNSGPRSARFLCSQRIDTLRNSSACRDNAAKKRKRETVKSECCKGVLTIKILAGGFRTVCCMHDYVHESARSQRKLPQDVIEDIEHGAENGFSPFQLATYLSKKTNIDLTWSQVYYRWGLKMESFYKRDQDVKKSARLLLRESAEMKEIIFSEKPYAIGFLCSHGADLCERIRVDEVFIDSTYKTNASKLELFAVLGSILGKGFPIAYLLVEEGCGGSRL